MNDTPLSSLSYSELINYITDDVLKDFGQAKYYKIQEKVLTSDKISGLLSTSKYKGLPPGSKDFVYSVIEIPYFMFSNLRIKTLASLLALSRWDNEVNNSNQYLDKDDLTQRAISIVRLHKGYKYEI